MPLQTPHHVGTHSSEPDHSNLHVCSLIQHVAASPAGFRPGKMTYAE
jgi:hypothetical protein